MNDQERKTLLIAYGIAEWQSAIDHLQALKRIDLIKDDFYADTIPILIDERDALIGQHLGHWPQYPDEVRTQVAWARVYLAARTRELGALLKQLDELKAMAE